MILGLDGTNCRWVVEQDFYRNFRVKVTWCFLFCSASLTESCSFSYGLKDLFPLHKLDDKLALNR